MRQDFSVKEQGKALVMANWQEYENWKEETRKTYKREAENATASAVGWTIAAVLGGLAVVLSDPSGLARGLWAVLTAIAVFTGWETALRARKRSDGVSVDLAWCDALRTTETVGDSWDAQAQAGTIAKAVEAFATQMKERKQTVEEAMEEDTFKNAPKDESEEATTRDVQRLCPHPKEGIYRVDTSGRYGCMRCGASLTERDVREAE